MKRIVGLMIVAALCAGCRSSQPVYDPFLGSTTVPPPGTATPPPGQPYYGSPAGAPVMAPPPATAPPPGATTAPVLPRGGVPLNFAPAPAGGMSSSFTPNVSPMQMQPGATPNLQPTPAGMPPGYGAMPMASVAPAGVRPSYPPPGGSYPNYPQAAMAPQYGVPTLAQPGAQPTLAQPASNTGAVPAGGVIPATRWAPAGQSSSNSSGPTTSSSPTSGNNVVAASTAAPAAQSSSPIRIVSPSGSMAQPPTTGPTTAGSSPTLNQSLAAAPPTSFVSPAMASNARIPEISELPPATGYLPATFTSGNSQTTGSMIPTTAKPNPVPASAAVPNSAIQLNSYGYDTQYRWLKGKLEYSQTTHTWRLRYIPPDGATDNYGGSVVLGDASKLNGLRPGDLVYAQGSPGAASGDQGSFAPLYNLAQIQKQ